MKFLWEVFRLLTPPWNKLFIDPLVSQERQISRQASHNWKYMLVSVLGMQVSCILCYTTPSSRSEINLVYVLLVGTFVGEIVYSIMLRWKLVIEITARTPQLLTRLLHSGDWELITISPVPKKQWLMRYVRVLSWQLSQPTRSLIAAHSIIAVIWYVYAVPITLLTDTPVSAAMLYLFILLLGAVCFIVMPIWEMGIMVSIGLFTGSLTKHSSFAVTYCVLGLFLYRVTALALFLSVIFAFTDTSQFLNYLWIWIPTLLFMAFFLEWFALGLPVAIASSSTPMLAAVTWLGASIMVYFLLPGAMINLFLSLTARRLEKQD